MRILIKQSSALWAIMVLVAVGYGQERTSVPIPSDGNRAAFQRLLEDIKSPKADRAPDAPPGLEVAAAEVLRLDTLVEEVRRSNPEIQAARKKFEARRTRPSQESTLPEPTIGFMSTNMGNPVPFTTIGKDPQSNAGISISQEIPYPGKLKRKGDVARKEADSEWQNFQATQWNVIARLKVAYYDLYYLYKATEVINKDKDLLEKIAKIAEAHYEVGQGIQQDLLKAQVEISAFLARLAQVEQKKYSAIAQINSLLNRPPESPLGRPAPFEKTTLAYTLEDLNKMARHGSPTIQSRRERIARDSLALDLSRRQYYPDFMVSGYYGNAGGLPDMWQLRLDVRLPLYFWRKQRYGVEESVHSLMQSKKEYEAAAQMVNFQVKDQYLQAVASERLINLYAQRIIPQTTLALESSLSSYEVGKLDFLSLLNNFMAVLTYELSYYEELTNYQKALARLEEVVAVPLIP